VKHNHLWDMPATFAGFTPGFNKINDLISIQLAWSSIIKTTIQLFQWVNLYEETGADLFFVLEISGVTR